MLFRLNELKGRLRDSGQPARWEDIAEATGISKPTLIALSKGDAKEIKPIYVDILCTFFDVDPGGLMAAERVDLPHNLNLRPDRHGRSPNPKVSND